MQRPGDMTDSFGTRDDSLSPVELTGRLWASAGQRSLEQARVLLIGHDAAGTQTLKNLVLPGELNDKPTGTSLRSSAGISHFTVLSPKITTAQDVSTNFFLHPDDIGSSIAESVVK